MMEINNIISLGPSCINSYYFKSKKYKKQSYPFDWIFSDLYIINHCLEDDFECFMDKSKHKTVSPTKSLHTTYKTKKDIFEHHNICSTNGYSYFERCITRFRNIRELKGTSLFISMINHTMFNEFHEHTPVDPLHVSLLCENLKKYAKDFILCVVYITSTDLPKGYTRKIENSHLHIVNLNITGFMKGLDFENKKGLDLFDKMLHEYFIFST